MISWNFVRQTLSWLTFYSVALSLTQFFDGIRDTLVRGPVNTAQAPNHDVGYVRGGRIRREKNKTRHGDGTWGEMCITSWDSKCNVRTHNAIIMRTRPRSRREARRTGAQRKKAEDKETRARTRTLPGVTHPESAVATVLLRGDKFSTGKSLVLHSRNVATQSAEPRIKLAVSLLTRIRRKI